MLDDVLMHGATRGWVQEVAHGKPARTILDIGGRDVNGTCRNLFPLAEKYVSLDIAPGPGVDIVADARTWRTSERFDIVICVNVFEHVERWRDIIDTAHEALRTGGLFICSMAGPGCRPHSGIDDSADPHPGEWYKSVTREELTQALVVAGFGNLGTSNGGRKKMTDTFGYAYRTL
jgi:SAM-dependent methyltransferase